MSFGWAKVAVYFAKDDPYAPFYREALGHSGLTYEKLDEVSAREISRFHVLVLCGYGKLSPGDAEGVSEFVKKGGSVVCSGSAWGLEQLLGIHPESKHVSNALAHPTGEDRLWPSGTESVRFLGGEAHRASSCETVANCGDWVAISKRKIGKAVAVYVAPHVGQTLRLMQSGKSVECDSIGPSDDSAILDNGILRAEDGTVLDFERDRKTVEGCDTPFFAYAHADAVREMLVRAILFAVDQRGLSVPLVWHWPHNARGTAMLTLDCEEFEREPVNQWHRMLAMFGTPAAWIVGLPGFPLDVYRAMKGWDHELGLLFLTDDQIGWHEEKLKIQFTAMTRLTAHPSLVSARPQNGRWKGWHTFYELCELAGARVSVSKGGRQPGTSGFLFGTSHPFFPARRDGSPCLVTEIPYTTFSPGTVTPVSVAEDILLQTAHRYGCYHIACPVQAISTPEVASAFRRLLSLCKQQRLTFTLPDQVHKFERGRRQVRITQKLLDDEGTLLISSDVPLEGLTILFSGPRIEAGTKNREALVEPVVRYGTHFSAVTINLEAKQQVELRICLATHAQAA